MICTVKGQRQTLKIRTTDPSKGNKWNRGYEPKKKVQQTEVTNVFT